jgi:prepilin-type processing-associated H-X9-DG protein
MEPEYQTTVRRPQPKFDCPSESADQTGDGGPATTSYLGNAGTGVQRYGYNGLFRPPVVNQTPQIWRGGPVRVRDVRDGLSNTAAMAEVRHGIAYQYDRLRTVWETPQTMLEPAELDAFAELCRSIPDDPPRYGWRGVPKFLGGNWLEGSLPYTLYTHVLTPNNPSCSNRTKVQEGIYTAGSLHPGGANLLYVDGHVRFISDSIDGIAWREIGSRVEYDLLNVPF